MTSGTVILLTGILCAMACALPGTFLILRRMAMMTDAISHAILPGLVFGYWLANSPNLLVGAVGATGAAILTVSLVEALQRTRRVGGSEAMGIVFPAMFALGTILISRYFSNVHLDTDAILYGNIEFSAFERLVIGGDDLGPQSLWVMSILLIVNIGVLTLLYKELKISTFDPALTQSLGFNPILIHYLLMLLLSITTVGAFTAVGAILVVALVIVPAATAYLLTDRLIEMMVGSAIIGALAAIGGYWLAMWIDGSIAGGIVTMAGLFFALALLFSPQQGLVAQRRQAHLNRQRFALDMLVMHLYTHERTADEYSESSLGHIGAALHWNPDQAMRTIGRAVDRGMVVRANGNVVLTEQGRHYVQRLSVMDRVRSE
ncbi:MAG: metal ABC transporter permease [Thermomicrobiales bacterium]|nr:metal ABC transporter permease [Thermomicrobiales bacterium]